MRKTNILFACLAVVAGCLTINAENQNLGSGSSTDGNISVHYVTVAEPAIKRPGGSDSPVDSRTTRKSCTAGC